MARNTYDWFKFENRAWMESERRSRMPLAAQAVYLLALCYQAVQGSLPSNTAELARRLDLCEPFDQWDCVLQHFDSEEVEGEVRFFNAKLREHLNERGKVSEAKAANRKNKRKTNDKHALNKRKTKAPVHASKSKSVSISQSVEDNSSSFKGSAEGENDFGFAEFWDKYPRKDNRKGALALWLKLKPSPDLRARIVAHVEQQKLSVQWLKDAGQFIPLPTTYLNLQRWEDQGVQGLPKANGSRRGVVSQPGFITHDPETSVLLTPEEMEEAEREKRENLKWLGENA